MDPNAVFGGVLCACLGLMFMFLYKFLAGNVNLQFFWYKSPLMTPESSYGKKWGRRYVLGLGLLILLLGLFVILIGYLDII